MTNLTTASSRLRAAMDFVRRCKLHFIVTVHVVV